MPLCTNLTEEVNHQLNICNPWELCLDSWGGLVQARAPESLSWLGKGMCWKMVYNFLTSHPDRLRIKRPISIRCTWWGLLGQGWLFPASSARENPFPWSTPFPKLDRVTKAKPLFVGSHRALSTNWRARAPPQGCFALGMLKPWGSSPSFFIHPVSFLLRMAYLSILTESRSTVQFSFSCLFCQACHSPSLPGLQLCSWLHYLLSEWTKCLPSFTFA